MDKLEWLEAMMRKQTLRSYPRTADSENLALPSLVRIFKSHVSALDGLPSQERFLRAVIAEAADLPEAGVRARASRTYPAFVRQEHFRVALQTRTTLQGVYWIVDLDMAGIDLLVLDRGCALGVALSVKTGTAANWKQVKRQRHPPLAGLEMLSLEADPETAPRIGPFWVHPLSDVWTVERAVETLHKWRQVA